MHGSLSGAAGYRSQATRSTIPGTTSARMGRYPGQSEAPRGTTGVLLPRVGPETGRGDEVSGTDARAACRPTCRSAGHQTDRRGTTRSMWRRGTCPARHVAAMYHFIAAPPESVSRNGPCPGRTRSNTCTLARSRNGQTPEDTEAGHRRAPTPAMPRLPTPKGARRLSARRAARNPLATSPTTARPTPSR